MKIAINATSSVAGGGYLYKKPANWFIKNRDCPPIHSSYNRRRKGKILFPAPSFHLFVVQNTLPKSVTPPLLGADVPGVVVKKAEG